jgi:hypothetical protein
MTCLSPDTSWWERELGVVVRAQCTQVRRRKPPCRHAWPWVLRFVGRVRRWLPTLPAKKKETKGEAWCMYSLFIHERLASDRAGNNCVRGRMCYINVRTDINWRNGTRKSQVHFYLQPAYGETRPFRWLTATSVPRLLLPGVRRHRQTPGASGGAMILRLGIPHIKNFQYICAIVIRDKINTKLILMHTLSSTYNFLKIYAR